MCIELTVSFRALDVVSILQVPVHASVLELEMVSALRLPELQLDETGSMLTSHCHIYTRHPSLHAGGNNLPDPSLIPDPQPPTRVADAALVHWRNVCAKRGWRCRSGYQNMAELADWVVADVLAAVDEFWPKRKLPPACVLDGRVCMCMCLSVCVCVSCVRFVVCMRVVEMRWMKRFTSLCAGLCRACVAGGCFLCPPPGTSCGPCHPWRLPTCAKPFPSCPACAQRKCSD